MTKREHLETLFDQFKVDTLVIPQGEFLRGLDRLRAAHGDSQYLDADVQRDQAINFQWGHDHDFGPFSLGGAMGKRHIGLIDEFVGNGSLPLDLTGKRVLDIGCWTGGTTLMLAAMGAEVEGIEEVGLYASTAQYLIESWGLDKQASVSRASLYDLLGLDGQPIWNDYFDYVLFAGVLYHLTDPVLALRIIFDMLKDGGQMLLETEVCPWAERPSMIYEGPGIFKRGGTKEARNRRGWNWLIPSLDALWTMTKDVGFELAACGTMGSRTFLTAERKKFVDMTRAGLSRPGVR